MRSRLFGGLAVVTFGITSLAYLAVGLPLENQNTPGITDTRSNAQQSRTWTFFPNIFKVEKAKATRLVAVVGKNCKPCRRFKLYTMVRLLAEGYDVSTMDKDAWNKQRRELQPKNPTYLVSSVPTLVYANEKGKILRFEIGFKTPEQVKKYLHKVEKP